MNLKKKLERVKGAIEKLPKNVKRASLIPVTALVVSLVSGCNSGNSEDFSKKAETSYVDHLVTLKDNCLDSSYGLYRQFGGPFILKVEPTGNTYAEIYKTIDRVKEIIEENGGLDYPILYDIETLMQDDYLKANCLLAEEFCNKLIANGCYAGLYGSDKSMEKFEEKFKEVTDTHSIDLYDKLIVYDGKEVNYDGVYNMKQQSGKEIEFAYDLKQVINDQNLNKSSNFVDDTIYTIQSGDNLATLSASVGMRMRDLAEYNEIDDINKIMIGQTIKIPNQYVEDDVIIDSEKENIDQEEMPSEISTRMVKGIDVSEYQGDIEWEKVSGEIDFAILKLCDFINKNEDGTCRLDKKFLYNMEMCEKLDIPVGVYYFSRAITEEEAKAEARFVAESLKEYSLEYPVYMDIETKKQNEMIDTEPSKMEAVVAAAMKELENEEYFSGVYCNRGSDNNTNRQKFINDMSEQYSFWVTSNATYNVDVDFDNFKTPSYQVEYLPDSNIPVYQYCQTGSIDGIDGMVDLDYGSVHLAETIEDKGFNKVKK